ncbi:MAG TPA: diaminopimelate epimerase [Actinomycetes bacterium]|nr:diaminopimelate epimerase [Actinomycetes bacterium]
MSLDPGTVEFVKGHGTANDFVVLPDPDGRLALTPARVRALCDRRAGLGGDGVLRVVRVEAAGPDAAAHRGAAEWFMDYRNADGSVAEMCGNGVRVFARYLVEAGLAARGPLTVAPRGGRKHVRFEDSGEITVDMGPATLVEAEPTVSVDGRSWAALAVFAPNPHAVVFVDDLAQAGTLLAAPHVEAPSIYPDGVNVEFVVDRGPTHVAMRVHERGVGETRSCGTGACAVAVAARRRAGWAPADETDRVWTVDVPGGRLRVTERADGHLELTGPAVLVSSGTLEPTWWTAHA